ncbi:AAA family ATPase [Candidatus Woesearchaeota archaeon]|nr:AAA family ATPase [Candidatus Woesearchaeota archaeon]
MGVFDKILKADESLFKNIDALDFAFVPKIIPYREGEQRRVAAAVQPLFSDRNGKNLLIHGLPGVGKTVACKKVLQELEEKSDDIIPIYVNCWQKNTSYKVVIEICEQLGYRFTQNKKTDELFKEIVKQLNKRKVVFVFDEIDKAEDSDFIYTLLEDIYRKTIILITNYRTYLEGMDDRITSRLMPELIEFKPYNVDEMSGILKQRLEYAFFPDVWETEAFEMVVQKAASLQDVRVGIHLLKDCGDAAENKASRKITSDHAKESLAKRDEFETLRSTDLKNEDKVILSIVKKNSKKKIGELFRLYTEAGGKSVYKTFQRKIKALEEQGFVNLTKSTGEGGNTTIVEYKERTKTLADF